MDSVVAAHADGGQPRMVNPGLILPMPMPGESVRSVWERFHRMGIQAPTRETLEALFGPKARQRFGHRMPARVSQLSKRVGADHPLGDPNVVAQRHTMLPYSCYFHTPQQRENAYQAIQRERGAASARAMIGDAIRDQRAERLWPAFCPDCIRNDLRYGFTYWRVVHQLPTVVVCPWHGCQLRERRPTNKAVNLGVVTAFPPPDLSIEDAEDFPLVEVDQRIDREALLRLAEASLHMQEHPQGFPGDWRTSMVAALREMGYRSRNGLNHAAISRLLVQAHGAPMLEWLGIAKLGKPIDLKILKRMLGFQRERCDTPLYLMLALAIRADLPTLERDLESLRENPSSAVRGFLPAWAQELPADHAAGHSAQELAKKYGVPTTSIRRYLLRLGLSLDGRSQALTPARQNEFFAAARGGVRSTDLRKQCSLSKFAVPLLLRDDERARLAVEAADFAASRDQLRLRALTTMKRHPGISVEALAKKLSTAHRLLRTYDLRWCEENLPAPRSLGRWVTESMSASAIDIKLSVQVTKVIKVLRDNEQVPKLTTDLVLMKCRATNAYLHHRGRLPLTEKALRSTRLDQQ
ncbi:MAG: hypothetical protein C0434_02555 [Xanthomonadaceae bacterium]|nr:hypothetical protein [Xanthomonadaceae bacterium]